ncbi:hypothetical protein [Pseudoteredinibacter isoporae]|uniref:hypothetical protein n=1 Tax=Pseudoteredinibacter isoporae TaxID=570281 RepID=UPI0031093A7F
MTPALPANPYLLIAAALSAIAAFLHLAIILGGPDWYRFFGAGEAMAQMAERGEIKPTLITLGIATVLFSWCLYALSAAGKIPPLPLLRTALVVITTIYLLRGLSVLLMAILQDEFREPFWIWSSLICTAFGGVYAIGSWQQWGYLSTAAR